MYLKMYLNEVHVSLYLTFHILWYFGYPYFKNFQEFLEFSVISWYVIYACCGLILTLNKLIWLVRIIFKIPHFLPHYLPQWGKWGICFILPHFLYIEILWYLYFKNFQCVSCSFMFLTLLIVPHFVPHNVPQWGTWGTCFIVPHFFIYILRRGCT